MKSGVLALILLAALGSAGLAGPLNPCPAGSLQDYIDLGAGGCTLGAALFYNFGDSSVFGSTPGADPIPAGSIQVVPFGNSLSPGFEFLVSALLGPGELRQARIGYTVGLSAAGTLTARLAMSGSSVAPDGGATVIEELCSGGEFFAPGLCPDPNSLGFLPTEALIVFDIGVDAGLSDGLELQQLTTLGVLNDIVVDGGLAGSAGIGSVSNQFTIVPEPGTIWLLSAGFLCGWLGCWRRKAQ
jgi:hypothetical protein